jgi:hypothetical protein
VAPEQRAITFRLGVLGTGGTRAIRIFVAMLVGPVAAALVVLFVATVFLSSLSPLGWLLLAGFTALSCMALWSLVRPLVTTTLSIGTDGVVVRRLGRRRFVPRASLDAVEARDGEVVLARVKGDPLRVRTSGQPEADAVVLRIREAIASPEARGAPELDRLDRRGRAVSAWLRDLRALAAGPGGYRDASLDLRALLDVVEDGGAPPEHRIAAAAALSGAPDEQAFFRARVRVAAQACADTRLREAIERAGEGDLEEDLVAQAVRAHAEPRA